jgi:hypothetical protein
MATRRTYYATWNRKLWSFITYNDAYQKRMRKKTGMDQNALNALSALQSALDAAATAFPQRIELP